MPEKLDMNRKRSPVMQWWIDLGFLDPETHRLIEASPNVYNAKRKMWSMPPDYRHGMEEKKDGA